MVNRSFPQHRTSSTSRFLLRKSSPFAFSLCLIFIFASSIFVFFFFCARNVLEDEQKPLFPEPEEFPSHSHAKSEQKSVDHLWDAPSSHGFHPCVKPTSRYGAAQTSDRYITVRSNGGLNQMRAGISDMVAVAHIMNGTLVIPQLDKRSFWHDTSTFSDIFDEHHFIKTLRSDIKIVKELPKELESIPHARKHFTSWAGFGYYEEMTRLWKDYQVIHVAKSDSRLANNDLPLDIQRLRCRAMYEALHFAPPIENFGKKLVERLRLRGGRYIALHLRYEKDMLSFTGCTYGLTHLEAEELEIMREKTPHWKIKNINSTQQRIEGLCPLTPKEVGIFLQALGYLPSTLIYIAAGEIYGGDTRLSELSSRFPNIVTKETLATEEELKPFINHASQSAALDYIISIESDVFVPTYSGNMARAVEGHRRYLGHRKTITPDRKGLVDIFDKLEKGQLGEGSSLSDHVRRMHKNRQGGPRKRRGPQPGIKGRARFRTEESFFENPYECICKSKQ
ncbi:O-fucosyltransferase 38 isoform X1 [Cucurbita maxima]|uniref:O-fucosyltransferase family protein n=1 Tax=Cucurbita maxima TaxID=3661 RepID=A0A6J1KWW7_CUCMA|nr:O-fucosyltransferase 38 isoform X1 [Cucurbita maxima]